MQNLSPRLQGLIAINFAAVIFGSAALYGKMDVSPFWIVILRAAFAAASLLTLGTYRQKLELLPRSLWPVTFSTSVILAVHWLTFFASVQMAGVAIATLTFAAFPMFTVLIEVLLQKRRPNFAEGIAGIAIIFAVGLLVDPNNSGENKTLGIVAGLVSAITFAWFGIASKKLSKALSPLLISLYQNTLVAILLVPSLFFASMPPDQPQEWVFLALLGIVTTALMHQLYFYALQRLSASTCSGFVALEPVYAIIFASLFFHEKITYWVILSALLVVGASLALLRQES